MNQGEQFEQGSKNCKDNMLQMGILFVYPCFVTLSSTKLNKSYKIMGEKEIMTLTWNYKNNVVSVSWEDRKSS